jgi:hypothetical protein
MKLLGKEIKIDIDVPFGIFEDIQNDPENAVITKRFVSALTGLTQKDVRRLKMSEIKNVMAEFRRLQEIETRESKKKLSLS